MASCESCGRDGETVVKVQRMYLADAPRGVAGPEEIGAEPRTLDGDTTPVAGDIEYWCASCCATFPHVSVEPD